MTQNGGYAEPGFAAAASLGSVVLFVHALRRSVRFYETGAGKDVTVRAESTALLVAAHGFQLYLREMGAHAAHALGSVGIQYVVWTAATTDDLDRFDSKRSSRISVRTRPRQSRWHHRRRGTRPERPADPHGASWSGASAPSAHDAPDLRLASSASRDASVTTHPHRPRLSCQN